MTQAAQVILAFGVGLAAGVGATLFALVFIGAALDEPAVKD